MYRGLSPDPAARNPKFEVQALKHSSPAVSGPRNSTCTDLRLFAERSHALRKCSKPTEKQLFFQNPIHVSESGDFSRIDVISGFGSVFCGLASAWQTATFPSAAARPPNFASSGQWSSSGLRAAGTHASVSRLRAPALLCVCVYLLIFVTWLRFSRVCRCAGNLRKHESYCRK